MEPATKAADGTTIYEAGSRYSPPKDSPAADKWEKEQPTPRQKRLKFLGQLCGAFVLPTTCYFLYRRELLRERLLAEQALADRIANVNPAVAKVGLGGPFQLEDARNKCLVDDVAVFDQNWTLLYFGFTKCAEICPKNLKFIGRVMEGVIDSVTPKDMLRDPEINERIASLQACFVSVDYIRDDAKTTQEYVDRFFGHDRYFPDENASEEEKRRADKLTKTERRTLRCRGLCGKKDQIETATKAWRVYYSPLTESEDEKRARERAGKSEEELCKENDNYQFDHSAAIYLVGPDGKLKDFFFEEMGVEHAVDRITQHWDDAFGLGIENRKGKKRKAAA